MHNTTHHISLLGTGLIGSFYAMTLLSHRRRDKIEAVYSRSEERGKKFAKQWNIERSYTNLKKAAQDDKTDTVIVALPNHLHKEAIMAAIEAGKSVLCTKPLAMNGQEALEILEAVEKAGVYHGYLEDLAYTSKTLDALKAVRRGALGDILWTRSREAHPGPHSDWFWDSEKSGGGAIIDMGCHCIEIGRNFVGKDVKPLEVMCWADTLVKPINAEDHAVGLVRYETGAVTQFEVSWAFRGGMDLRDEVSGTEGTLRLDHFLNTGYDFFTAVGMRGYVAEKAEQETGWLSPVGDEIHALGYDQMFTDMFDAMDRQQSPMETFYDAYIVNSIMDACYASAKSKKWEPVNLPLWRGSSDAIRQHGAKEYDVDHWLIKEEHLPDGRKKVILKVKEGGKIIEKVLNG
ncbi:Gfo/Idh/MocA family oxidoreductase [Porifericola rhodea]|uniref:Gfo/Idh/MocA family protein n=1 Tax=Porifericola rhodea TaxID=930972 RepID=UPI002666ED63|nr:Gfo/Idh/MocA family oxidoreductase [Porifericola rhodea]WKN30129.1 Gfo/Idh/MocA family oxidoreductase [Porifericola rhodea]